MSDEDEAHKIALAVLLRLFQQQPEAFEALMAMLSKSSKSRLIYALRASAQENLDLASRYEWAADQAERLLSEASTD